MHGLHFGLSQPQANDWIHRLLPVWQQALRTLGEAPERDARRVATSALACAGGPDLTMDGSERRRQRPQDHAKQKKHYSGKKKAHTDKNTAIPAYSLVTSSSHVNNMICSGVEQLLCLDARRIVIRRG